ncbi:MAG: polyprenyl synthetase family protein [Planctomycetes bacterium]|nr:polyprenyl synthetase family protein [Planctomycetota bacterium]
MRYSLFAGGKRLRPALALLACELLGGRERDALPVACAFEVIHTYSLIHDDLPAMDDDDFRRGKPSSHKQFGEAMAILAGDGLLTFAFELVTRTPAAERIPALVREVAVAAGTLGMVGGQVLDLDATATSGGTAALLEEIHLRKTAAMILGSARAGGVAAGGAASDLAALGRYGKHLGLAFQIADDLLDVEGATEQLGKTAGKDAQAGKLTYPALFGLAASRREARSHVEAAQAALSRFGDRADRLRALAAYVVSRTH